MNRTELLNVAKPILFNTEMVQAIMDDYKKSTRRIANIATNIPCNDGCEHQFIRDDFCEGEPYTGYVCKHCGYGVSFPHMNTPVGTSFIRPKYNVGDILYVKETWNETTHGYNYKASPLGNSRDTYPWRPSVHMPKEAARIFLKVTDVRLERLQKIITGDYKTPINIKNEGLYTPCLRCKHFNGDCKDFIADNTCVLVDEWIKFWNGTVDKKKLKSFGWDSNPWVWVFDFERIDT